MPVKSTLAHLGAVIGAGLMLCTASAANAAIIYDNGMPDLVNALVSDFDFPQQKGDDFTFASAQVIRDFHWWGAYSLDNTPPALDDFTIRIFAITAGVPEVSPSILDLHIGHVSRVATGDTIGQFDVYAYSVEIADLAMAAGTYLLSIVNNTPATPSFDRWNWATSANDTGDNVLRDVDGESWEADDSELAFNITNDITIPEPATLALFGLGLAGLGLARRKRAA